jgi:hypothetical protein
MSFIKDDDDMRIRGCRAGSVMILLLAICAFSGFFSYGRDRKPTEMPVQTILADYIIPAIE